MAHYFLELSGRVEYVTIAADDLEAHNATRHRVNHATGFMTPSRVLPPVVGRSVDQEHLRQEILALLAGPAAGWIFQGEGSRPIKPSPEERDEFELHSDGRDDFSRVYRLLQSADPLNPRAVAQTIRRDAAEALDQQLLIERYGMPAFDAHIQKLRAEFKSCWQDALEFVIARWCHVQAVADALWRKRTLAGGEVETIIEVMENRIRTGPSEVRSVWTS